MQFRFAAALAAGLLVVACGGGGVDSAAESTGALRAPARAAATLTPSEVLDWAEGAYSDLFPGHAENQSLLQYVYRFYPATGNYLGLAGEEVYVMGPVGGGGLMRVGALSDFRCAIAPPSCGPAVSGVAAAAAALELARVTVRDASGNSASASTDHAGRFSAATPQLKGPLLLRADTATGTRFYGVTSDLNSVTTANISPISDLVVRSWYAVQSTDPDTAFSSLGAYPAPDALQVQAIAQQFASVLQGAAAAYGLDLTDGTDLLSKPASPALLKLLSHTTVKPGERPVITVSLPEATQTVSVTYDPAGSAMALSSNTVAASGATATTLTAVVPVPSKLTTVDIRVAGLNLAAHKGAPSGGTLVIANYALGTLGQAYLGKVTITAEGSYSLPTLRGAVTIKKIVQQPVNQACEFTNRRVTTWDPYTNQLIDESTADVYCYEKPCGGLSSLGEAPPPKGLQVIRDPDGQSATASWKNDPWGTAYEIYYGTDPVVVTSDRITGFAVYQRKTLGLFDHTSIGNLDPTKEYYFAVTSFYNSPSNLDYCQSAASTETVRIAVIPPPVVISSVGPTTALVNQTTTYTVSGTNLVDGMTFKVGACTGVELSGGTSTSRKFSCASQVEGTNQGEVRKGGELLKSFSVQVSAPVRPAVSSVTPTTAFLGQTMTFSVTGRNLGDGLKFQTTGCTGTEVGGGTSTLRKFTCKPQILDGNSGEIRDKDGTQVATFTVNVVTSICTDITTESPFRKYCYYIDPQGRQIRHGNSDTYFSAAGTLLWTRETYANGVLNGPALYYDNYPDSGYYLHWEGSYLNGDKAGTTWKSYFTSAPTDGVDGLGKLSDETTYGSYKGYTIEFVRKTYCNYKSAYPTKRGKLAGVYTFDPATGTSGWQYMFKDGCTGPN